MLVSMSLCFCLVALFCVWLSSWPQTGRGLLARGALRGFSGVRFVAYGGSPEKTLRLLKWRVVCVQEAVRQHKVTAFEPEPRESHWEFARENKNACLGLSRPGEDAFLSSSCSSFLALRRSLPRRRLGSKSRKLANAATPAGRAEQKTFTFTLWVVSVRGSLAQAPAQKTAFRLVGRIASSL